MPAIAANRCRASSGSAHTSSLRLLSSLFFIWEFISVTNNMLLPRLRSVFDLSYAETTLMESV